MTRLAVKEYLRSTWVQPANVTRILANQTTFTAFSTLRQIPKYEKLGTGLFAITGPSRRTEKRLSGARGAGQKKAIYSMRLWFYGITKNELTGGDAFDTCWEQLLAVIRDTAIQRGITDPVTGVQSWLHDISEALDDTIEEPQLAAPQGLVRFFAEAYMIIEEVYND